ncbi:hypothetical protein O3W44_22720 [Pantoea sp. LMR881]|uniref:hypothetical protein n=1 Tax=Pantoea sp. LMR881 TaxID=3014336 RepID=UPI0022AF5465|nr:hypothetical protein [Pantoea sp. LMR881]MCZ4061348.1 hypothetical protein [Pantoea sp. LMR881]
MGDLIGWAWDLVSAWGHALGYDSRQMDEIANYVSEHATPEYLTAVNEAMSTGKRIPKVEELNNAAEHQQEEEEAPLNEADTAAQAGIDYLHGLLSFQSTDPASIDAELAKVEDIAATLTNAGQMDENEDLLNHVADHLVSLSVAVAQGGN